MVGRDAVHDFIVDASRADSDSDADAVLPQLTPEQSVHPLVRRIGGGLTVRRAVAVLLPQITEREMRKYNNIFWVFANRLYAHTLPSSSSFLSEPS